MSLTPDEIQKMLDVVRATQAVEIDCDDSERSCHELLHEMEMLVDELGTPFIPVRGDGFVFLRPPSN